VMSNSFRLCSTVISQDRIHSGDSVVFPETLGISNAISGPEIIGFRSSFICPEKISLG
jgi:hypothetical protein